MLKLNGIIRYPIGERELPQERERERERESREDANDEPNEKADSSTFKLG